MKNARIGASLLKKGHTMNRVPTTYKIQANNGNCCKICSNYRTDANGKPICNPFGFSESICGYDALKIQFKEIDKIQANMGTCSYFFNYRAR